MRSSVRSSSWCLMGGRHCAQPLHVRRDRLLVTAFKQRDQPRSGRKYAPPRPADAEVLEDIFCAAMTRERLRQHTLLRPVGSWGPSPLLGTTGREDARAEMGLLLHVLGESSMARVLVSCGSGDLAAELCGMPNVVHLDVVGSDPQQLALAALRLLALQMLEGSAVRHLLGMDSTDNVDQCRSGASRDALYNALSASRALPHVVTRMLDDLRETDLKFGICGAGRIEQAARQATREFLEGEHELSLFSEELWAAHADPQLAQHHGLDVSDAAWSTRSAIIAEGVVRRVRAAHERARALCGRDGARERVLAARLLQRDTFVSVALLGSVAPPSALAHCYSDEGASTIAERLASGKLTVELDEGSIFSKGPDLAEAAGTGYSLISVCEDDGLEPTAHVAAVQLRGLAASLAPGGLLVLRSSGVAQHLVGAPTPRQLLEAAGLVVDRDVQHIARSCEESVLYAHDDGIVVGLKRSG